MPAPTYAVGIDLGTSNSCVSFFDEEKNRTIILPDAQSNSNITPSTIQFTPEGKCIVGQPLQKNATTTQHIQSIKRLIGRGFNEKEVQQDRKILHYQIEEGNDGGVVIDLGNNIKMTPVEISAEIIKALIANAEAGIKRIKKLNVTPILDVTITVPAYFTVSQKEATKKAATLAGIKNVTLLEEPVAAALSYGIATKQQDKRKKVAVYDLGGGTFDVSVVQMEKGKYQTLTTKGDMHLGGDDVDNDIIASLKTKISVKSGQEIANTAHNKYRLRKYAKEIKERLTDEDEVEIAVQGIETQDKQVIDQDISFSRTELNTLLDPIIKRTLNICKQALNEKKVRQPWWERVWNTLVDIISRIKTFFTRATQNSENKEKASIHHNIDEVVLVGGMTRIPYIQQRVEEFLGKKPHTGLNPDEAVAVGAGVHSAVRIGCNGVENIELLNAVPLSIGLKTKPYGKQESIFHPLIKQGSKVPAKAEGIFTTYDDNQPGVKIELYQGDSEKGNAISNYKKIGEVKFVGIKPAPKGVPKIQVEMRVDANGTLNISAEEGGKRIKSVLNSFSQISEEVIAEKKEQQKNQSPLINESLSTQVNAKYTQQQKSQNSKAEQQKQ